MGSSQRKMRKYTARFRPVLIFTAVLVCLSSRSVRGSMVDITSTSTESGSEATPTDSSPDSTEQLGTGIFAQVPFKVSISLRGGYDDNVSTSSTTFGKQGSTYTNGSVLANYEFGSARTRFSLKLNAGATYYWDTIRNAGGTNINNYDINNSLTLSVLHKATPRLTLSLEVLLT